HFTALVIVSVIVLPLAIVPVFADGSGAWWLVRWLTVPVLAVPLVVLVRLFGPIERSAPARSVPAARSALAAVATGVATVMLSAAFVLITLNGLSVVDGPLGVPMVALALLAGGTAIVRQPAARTCSTNLDAT